MPGMYAVTSIPFVKRTRATLRSAEFGFLGVAVYTRVQTPRFCGHSFKAGESDLRTKDLRPLRTNWLIVGMWAPPFQTIRFIIDPLDNMSFGYYQN